MTIKKYRIVKTCLRMVECPRHINRIETDTGNHGWQVRFDRVDEPYHSKLFSDGKYGGTLLALYEAEKHLEKIQPDYRYTEQCHIGQSDSVYFNWALRSGRNIKQLQAQIHLCQLNGKKRVKGYYVGTQQTVTDERIRLITEHCHRLIEWRNDIIARHGKDYLMVCQIPEHLDSYTWT